MRLSLWVVAQALALLMLATGCAAPPRTGSAATGPVASVVAAEGPAAAPDADDADRFEALGQGRASWYGKPFHGRRTASGERYDMHAFTAAHPTLPFGSRVKVRNRRNGKEVEVRINDRGPRSRGRIIDLSYAAASALGMVGPGEAPVELLAR